MDMAREKFQTFVNKHGGVAKLAEKLGLPRPTVHCWYVGIRSPSAKNLLLLKNFSKGQLSFEDILEGTAGGK